MWLRTTETYTLTVLKAKSLKSGCRALFPLKALGKNPSLPLLALVVPVVPWLVSHHFNLPPWSCHLLLCVFSVSVSYKAACSYI